MMSVDQWIIYVFGSTASWQSIQHHGARQRNTCMIEAFSRHPNVTCVVVVNYLPLQRFLQTLIAVFRGGTRQVKTQSKVRDVFLTRILPQRWWVPFHTVLNSTFIRFLLWVQTFRLKGSMAHQINWCYLPTGVTLATQLRARGPLAFDLDHNLVDDVNKWRSRSHVEKENLILTCAKSSDWMFAASRSMITWLQQRGFKNVYYLRNGVDSTRFEVFERCSGGLNNPTIGYCGVLSPWVDYQMLRELVRSNGQWQFVIIGPWYRMSPVQELESAENVEFVGQVPANELPKYLAKFDVALGLYRTEKWLDVDSMKLFEYLAAKIPVVSTEFHPWLERDFDGLVKTVPNSKLLIKRITDVLNQTEEQRKEWEEACERFVGLHSWDNRAAEVIRLISSQAVLLQTSINSLKI